MLWAGGHGVCHNVANTNFVVECLGLYLAAAAFQRLSQRVHQCGFACNGNHVQGHPRGTAVAWGNVLVGGGGDDVKGRAAGRSRCAGNPAITGEL